MKKITSVEQLASKLHSYGEIVQPYNYWTADGRLLPDTTARTSYFSSLPKALFECECNDRSHVIAPRVIESYWDTEDKQLVKRAKFEFDVFIYGHYSLEKTFSTKEFFLVKCKNDIVSCISPSTNGLLADNTNRGRVEFTCNLSCLQTLIEYQTSNHFKGTFIYETPFGIREET